MVADSGSSGRIRRPVFRPSVIHLALIIPWIGLVLGARRPVRDNSFLWHVTAGDLQLDSGSVLVSDPFSFTRAGQAWRTQSWLVELMYSMLDGWFGLAYLPWMMVIVGGLAIAAVMVASHRLTANVAATAATGVASVWIGSIYLNPRPVLFSYLFTGLVVVVLTAPRLRWTLPLLIWIWAAVHGSFVIGVGIVVLDAWRRRRVLEGLRWGLGLAVVASFTAHGIEIWRTLLAFFRSSGALDLITEWAPPDLTSLGLLPFVGGVVFLLAAAIRGRLTLADLWLVAPMLYLAVNASRSVYPAWLVLAPMMAMGVATTRAAQLTLPGRTVNLALMPILAMIPFLSPADSGLDPVRFPIEAVDCLDRQRPVFHDDVTGGFLIYAHYPEIRVFVDDRAELFGEDVFREVLEVRSGGPEWREILVRYGIDQVLISKDAAVTDDLAVDGWHERFVDDTWAVFDATVSEPC